MAACPLFLFLLLMVAAPVHAELQATVHEKEPAGMSGAFKVLGRGVLNAAGLPLEMVSSLRREWDAHPRAWLLTFVPRMIGDILIRAASATNDLFFFPWVAPRVGDIAPLTRGLELPDYPWQKE